MQTNEFIKGLEKKLKVKLEVKPSNFESMVGIYHDGVYVTAAPSSVIKEESDPQYTNEKGYPHKTMGYIEAKISNFLEQYKNPEFKQLMNEKM
jgi:hypothetical protein